MPLEYSARNKTKHSLQIIEQGRNLTTMKLKNHHHSYFILLKGIQCPLLYLEQSKSPNVNDLIWEVILSESISNMRLWILRFFESYAFFFFILCCKNKVANWRPEKSYWMSVILRITNQKLDSELFFFLVIKVGFHPPFSQVGI